jgi:hypothetical protein
LKIMGAPRNIEATIEATEEEIKELVEKKDGYIFRSEGKKGCIYFWLTPNRCWLLILPDKTERAENE